MKDKINISELLKDYPKEMELDCTMYQDVYFDYVDELNIIHCYIQHKTHKTSITFNQYGTLNSDIKSKCVIFPKGKTTWEGFVPSCKFKAGDILISETGNIVLLSHIDSKSIVHYHCIIPTYGSFRVEENTSVGVGRYYNCTLANEQQKKRMYDLIKCSGYRYNQGTNKLEKLIEPNFKVGDYVVKKGSISIPVSIIKISDEYYYYNTKKSVGIFSIKEQDKWELVKEPKFKIGDEIKKKDGIDHRLRTIESINNNYYIIKTPDWFDNCYTTDKLPFNCQDEYELVHSNKFDINTLKPFESRVLVRNVGAWEPAFWGYYSKEYAHPFVVDGGNTFAQCIPYEGNEHLIGKTDDCNSYYKIWEK